MRCATRTCSRPGCGRAQAGCSTRATAMRSTRSSPVSTTSGSVASPGCTPRWPPIGTRASSTPSSSWRRHLRSPAPPTSRRRTCCRGSSGSRGSGCARWSTPSAPTRPTPTSTRCASRPSRSATRPRRWLRSSGRRPARPPGGWPRCRTSWATTRTRSSPRSGCAPTSRCWPRGAGHRGRRPDATAIAFALGALVGDERAERAARRAEWPDAWARAADRDLWRWLR